MQNDSFLIKIGLLFSSNCTSSINDGTFDNLFNFLFCDLK